MTLTTTAPATTLRSAPRGAPATDRRAARARLRADIALAARVIAPVWPLDRFIAVNPLGGLESRPFEAALAAASSTLGALGTLDEGAFRGHHARGRITDADLRAALRRRLRQAADGTVQVGGDQWDAADALCADLVHGALAAEPDRATRTHSQRTAPAVARAVDDQTEKWCAAFLDDGQAAWAMPGRASGLFGAWRQLAKSDRSLPRRARERLSLLPDRADDAVLWALEALRVPAAEQRGYLQTHLGCMPGWAGHVRWRAEHNGDVELVDFLALRLVHEALLLEAAPALTAPPPARTAELATPSDMSRARSVAAILGAAPDVTAGELAALAALLGQLAVRDRCMVWLDAYESHYRDALLADLASGTTARHGSHPGAGPDEHASTRPAAQVVCCIDTRSEGLRRQIETTGPYETLGFAGFFAVAIQFRSLAGGAPSARCPVLLAPRNDIHERAVAGEERAATRQVAGERLIDAAERSFHAAKDDLIGPFALAEASGWLAGPGAAARTFAARSYGAARARLRGRIAVPARTDLSVEDGFTFDERVLFAEVALRMMGLVEGFGRLVVLCGHGSHTDNNPYGAALGCGACGGQAGGANARTAAAILNGPDVRDHLAGRGIDIPADTWFVAAEHDTASDRVVLLDEHLIPASHRAAWSVLAADLRTAGEGLSVERCAELPGAPSRPTPSAAARHVRGRGTDWAQVYPEWGNAGNAAFIVGPRTMTRGLNLQCRAFLHSYEAAADPTGTALETILTAPLVVAQWINCQYYFSAVDPATFGAGTKTTHNVVGGIGVVSGPGGDLRRGLPWQSLAVGNALVHEPMRLLAAAQAPLVRIDDVIGRNTILQQLFGNGWVALAARDSEQDAWQRYTPEGWLPWNTQEEDSVR